MTLPLYLPAAMDAWGLSMLKVVIGTTRSKTSSASPEATIRFTGSEESENPAR